MENLTIQNESSKNLPLKKHIIKDNLPDAIMTPYGVKPRHIYNSEKNKYMVFWGGKWRPATENWLQYVC